MVLIFSLSVQLNRTNRGRGRRYAWVSLFVGEGGHTCGVGGVCVDGGRVVVVGVRLTLVRLAPLDIPDIPTSGMLEAPPSSSSMSGAAEDSGGLLCHWAHTGRPFG